MRKFILMSIVLCLSSFAQTVQEISASSSIPISWQRVPHGVWKSPYGLRRLPRYFVNLISNGRFSYINPDKHLMKLLHRQGTITIDPLNDIHSSAEIKIFFLGDIMLSKSGNLPQLSLALNNLIKSADIIIANIESPVIESNAKMRRGLSLRFEMPIAYLKSIYDINSSAHWVFNLANNHALDTSDKNTVDISGLINTIRIIHQNIPEASIIGIDYNPARSVLGLLEKNGMKMGIIGWTDIMNNDSIHFKKPIIRGEDIQRSIIEQMKCQEKFDVLIGFAQGNEEQSYYPLKATRDRWNNIIGPHSFDIIVGTGPHVIQPAEEINGRLIFHSIGNFFSAGGQSQTKVGIIPEITLKLNQMTKKIDVHYEIHFIQQKNDQLSLFELRDATVLYPEIVNRLQRIWSTLF